jgi:DNA-binding NarL/FixJ family response regulator
MVPGVRRQVQENISHISTALTVTHHTQTTLVIVDGNCLIREGLHALLMNSGDVVVVGEVGEPEHVLGVVSAQHPDVVLVTLDGWGERERALLQALPKIAEQARTLVLTSEVDVTLHARAIELGALGVVLKTESAEVLTKAVRKVHAGELWLDRARTATIINQLTRKRAEDDPEVLRIASLTPRERQIVALVTEGLTNKAIAGRLVISEATARNHLTSILDKLQLKDRFQLAVYAFRRGLVRSPHERALSVPESAVAMQQGRPAPQEGER